jgi:hypothetical protein
MTDPDDPTPADDRTPWGAPQQPSTPPPPDGPALPGPALPGPALPGPALPDPSAAPPAYPVDPYRTTATSHYPTDPYGGDPYAARVAQVVHNASQPSKKMAGWALGLSIVPCCFGVTTLAGIGLAITVLIKSRDGRDHGRGLAIAALVIGAVWLIGGFIFGVVGGLQGWFEEDAVRDSQGRTTQTSEISTQRIRLGDCLDYPGLVDKTNDDPIEALTVTAIPCAEPHDVEAYHLQVLPDGEYPGDAVIVEKADDACLSTFKEFVGVSYGRSLLESYYLYPTSRSWGLMEDRTITCLIGAPDGKTSGTLRDSRR